MPLLPWYTLPLLAASIVLCSVHLQNLLHYMKFDHTCISICLPFKVFLIWEKKKKSCGSMSGECRGWRTYGVWLLAKNCCTSSLVHYNIFIHAPHCHFLVVCGKLHHLGILVSLNKNVCLQSGHLEYGHVA